MAGGIMKKMGFGVVLVACLVALIQDSSAATSHTVGDATGWTIPASSSLYSTWAANRSFKVGDSLVFNFATGSHTVAKVSKSDYDSCSTTSLISTNTAGPATVTIDSAGTHYYICTISGHCSLGQKLAVTTTTASSSSPTKSSSRASPPASDVATSPAPTPTEASGPSTSTIAPPPSSHATLSSAGLVLPFFMVVIAFWF